MSNMRPILHEVHIQNFLSYAKRFITDEILFHTKCTPFIGK